MAVNKVLNAVSLSIEVQNGTDAVVITSLYYAKPVDIGCNIEPV